jgi:hypothetical protein
MPIFSMILFVALSGCVAIEELKEHLRTEADAASPPAPRSKPPFVSKRVAPPPPPPRSKPTIASASIDRSPATNGFDPETLIGLQPAQAIAALGSPGSVQEQSPSMVWRYNAQGCALDLFFYMDLGANAFRVLAYEFKTGASPRRAADTCVTRFRAASNGQ